MTAPFVPRIKSINPRGLLSFGPDTPPLELGPLNVLIGSNASGKSNLIDLLRLVGSLPTDMQTPIRGGGGSEGWSWKGPAPDTNPSTAPSLELITSPLFSSEPFHHRLVLSGSQLPFFRLWSEVITDGDGVLYQSDLLNGRIHMRSGNGELVDIPYHEQHRRDQSALAQFVSPFLQAFGKVDHSQHNQSSNNHHTINHSMVFNSHFTQN